MNRPAVATLAALLFAGAIALTGQAQEASPAGTENAGAPGAEPTPSVVQHHYGPELWEFPYDAEQPMVVHVVDRSQNLIGEWAIIIPFARLPDGRVVALTPCDDLATPCVPLTTAATGALADAEDGDALVLAASEEGDPS